MTLLTPDEARKETCPLIRFCVNEAHVVQLGVPAIYQHQSCQGPDCKIGWRWATKPVPKRINWAGDANEPLREDEPPRPADVPLDWEWHDASWCGGDYPLHWAEPESSADRRRQGFCGAFGRPEEVR